MANPITPGFSLGPQRRLLGNASSSRICLKPQNPTVKMTSGSDVPRFDTTSEWALGHLEEANVEADRTVRSLCSCLDEMLAAWPTAPVAEDEKWADSGFIPKVVVLGPADGRHGE